MSILRSFPDINRKFSRVIFSIFKIKSSDKSFLIVKSFNRIHDEISLHLSLNPIVTYIFFRI